MLLYNPYDLIIIKKDVIPQENIDQLMLLTNDKNTTQATIIDNDENGKIEEGKTNTDVRNTLWYNITDEIHHNLEKAVATCFGQHVAPRYNCQFK